MNTLGSLPVIGAAMDRVDAPVKVSGKARYPNDFSYPGMAHAGLVRSTIAAGRIRGIDTSRAEAAPGVLGVITHLNAPRLERAPANHLGPSPLAPLQDERILHHGQHVGIVVATTEEQARYAASLVDVEYDAGEPLLDMYDPRAEVLTDPYGTDSERGDVDAGFVEADVVIEGDYTTPDNTNNPLGLMSVVAVWEGDTLTVHESTQWVHNVRDSLAAIFKVPESQVRVLAPYVGGGFGAGLRMWPHVVLTVLAARQIGRPVRLVLTRSEMFTVVGHRPSSVQHVKMGATSDGDLVAIEHQGTSALSMDDSDYEALTGGSAVLYACPNVRIRDRQVRLNIPVPGSMRAPGEAQGNFALESAIDELSYAVGMDPLEFRVRNVAREHPSLHLPWSSNALLECYEQGAERFGWSRRDPQPGSMRDGRWLVGYGVAGLAYPAYQVPCQARVSLNRDGSAFVRSAATDIGTGTYTVMTQLAAHLLGLTTAQVRFGLGDSDMPYSPQAGGSGLTGSLGNAVHEACRGLVREFLDLVADDADSPLSGAALDDVAVEGGRIHRTADPGLGEEYTAILARHGLEELSADGRGVPPEDLGMARGGPFGAKFVEVGVDPELGLLRVARVVSAVDGGRILNEKLAAGQIVGGTVGGIGQAMLEETATDAGTGRIANATLGDYLVPVNADVPDMDVIFVGGPDRATPIGTKGIGEIGLVGVAAAIANAVHHATGRRIRSLPIKIDRLML